MLHVSRDRASARVSGAVKIAVAQAGSGLDWESSKGDQKDANMSQMLLDSCETHSIDERRA